MLPEPLPIYVVIGSEPDTETRPLEIFMEPERAAAYVLDGLIQSLAMARMAGGLGSGDQVSMIVTMGRYGDDHHDESMTAGSFVVRTSHDQRVWDFRVEKRWAPRS